MTRSDIINKTWLASSQVAVEMEELLGEFDDDQRMRVLWMLMGFWAASEDAFHPVTGKRWLDAIREGL